MKKILLLFLCMCVPVQAFCAHPLKVKVEQKQAKTQKSYKKTFETGIVKEIEPVIAAQILYTGVLAEQESRKDLSRFNFPFSAAGFKGKFRDDTEYNFLVNFSKNISHEEYGKEILMEYYLTRKVAPNTKILLGQARVPIGMEGYLPPTVIPLISRAQIARTIGKTRDVGVQVSGNYKYFDTVVSLTDGTRYLRNVGTGKPDVATWVNFKPLAAHPECGKLIVGGGYNGGKEKFNYNVVGAYAKYQKGKFAVDGEYSNANGYNGAAASANKAEGYYVTTFYDVTPKVQLLTRYDHFDPNKDVLKNSTQEYTVGATYFQKGHNLKYMINYTFVDHQNAFEKHRFSVATQFIL